MLFQYSSKPKAMETVQVNLNDQILDVSGHYQKGTEDIIDDDQSGVQGTASRFEIETIIWRKSESPIHNIDVTDLINPLVDLEDKCIKEIES